MTSGLPVVVFCEVDGILFDRRTGSFDHAATLLDRLEQREVPLILCSGKTRAELERVQQRLGVSHPFVPEHGAATFVPRGYFGEDIGIARHVDEYEVIEFGMRCRRRV